MRQCEKCGRRFEGNETVCPDDGTILSSSGSFEEQAVGKTLDGKYRIDGFLKRGGMGAVYRGTHLMLGKPVAIKLINPEIVSSTEVVKRFLREARAAAHLSHANIVTVHDLGQTSDGTLYIAMELVDGKSLKELIVSEGAWEPRRAVRLAKGIAKALSLAHRKGVVHRDLKPQNIMVTPDEEGNEVPKLLDFGIAKTFEPDSPALTSTGMVLGTPHYMSSEQAKGLPADQRSDLYAVGVILYEMLVGQVPFNDTSIPQILIKHLNEAPKPPSTLNRNVPPALERVVLRCLEKDPEKRYQSAEELMQALDEVPDTAFGSAVGAVAAPMPPTLAETAVKETAVQHQARETTMAGGIAAVAPMPATPSHTATVRAPEVEVPSGRGSGRILLAGFAAILLLLAVASWLFLRGRGAEEVAQPAAATEAVPEEPTPSPDTEPAAIAGAGEEPSSDPEPVATTNANPGVATSQATSSAPAAVEVATAPPAPPVVQPEPEPAPALPERPALSVECDGVRDGCAALRNAIVDASRKDGLTMVRPAASDVLVRFVVEEIEARQEQQFGTTFVVRTYSVEGAGDSRHFDEELYLAPQMITFDSRFGREKLQEQSRLIASDVIGRVQEYWAQMTR